MSRDFETWLDTFRSSINQFDYYTDFQKVYRNVDAIKIELNLMNSLIGSKDIEADFRKLYADYPNILKCIPTLLAVRESEVFAMDAQGSHWYDFKKYGDTIDEYCTFMEKTGLFDLISNHIVSNLVDYATGTEVGLDTNGRKNRGGHQMEDLVETFISATGCEYAKEMKLADIERECDIDLSALSHNGEVTKRFDFVVKNKGVIYAIETNFYTGGGSKLNETARSYKTLALEAKEVKSPFKFVWITDGLGWRSARNNLKETFDVLPTVYNIAELENGVLNEVFDV